MKDIPQIPESSAAVHPDLRRSLVRMREELQSLLGLRGDGSGAALRAGSATGGSTTVIIDTGGPGGGGGGTPDLTPPPTPTFGPGDALPGITTVLLTWAGIGYTQGNGHKQTVIYGVQREPSNPSLPTFGDAQRIATAPNALTITSIPSEPNTRWHLWLKFETNDGVESTVPAGGTNGVTVTTGQNVADLLAVLNSQITQSQLAADLARPILSLDNRLDDAAVNLIEAFAQIVEESNGRAAAVLQEKVERVDADGAEAAARSLLAAQVNDPVTGLPVTRVALLEEASVRAEQTGHLAAQRTTRLDLNGYVVGYGISGTSGGTAGPTSQFLVRADQFAVVPPTNYTSETAPVGAALHERWYQPSTRIVRRWDGAAWVAFNSLPFVVQAAPTTVNGVTIPAGVYMDAAYIVNLTATYAQISNLVADQIVATEINAARLTLGDGTIGGRLKSSNYVSGSTGWIIRPDGTAEFSGVIVRGTIFATAGLIAGIAITAAGCNSSDYVPGTSGWAIKNDGTAEFGATSIRGPLTLAQLPQISDVALQASDTTVQTATTASEKTWVSVSRTQVSAGSPLLLTASARVRARVSGTNYTNVASVILSIYIYVDTEPENISETSATSGPVPLFSGVRYVQQSLSATAVIPAPAVGSRTYRIEARAQLKDADGNAINVGLIDCDSTANLVVLELKK